jgi:hypothetical protein
VITGIIVFLLFTLPFVVIPAGISPFETYKVIIAEILIEILMFVRLIYPKFYKFRRFNRQQIFIVSLLIALILIDFIIFKNSSDIFGNPFRLQGILLLCHLLIFSLLSSLIKLKVPSSIPIISLFLLLATTLLLGKNINSRFFGPLGEPNALAATTIFIFPFIFFCQKLPHKIMSFLLTFIIIFLSGSRSGMIALFIEMLFLSLIYKTKISQAKIFLVCLTLIILSLFLPFFENHPGIYEDRLMVWQTSFLAGLKSPIIGSGFGNIEPTIHTTALELNNAVRTQVVDSSHNFILDYFIQGGIVGLSILASLLFLSTKNLILSSKKMELTILLGLITVMSFNPASVVTLVGFWWIVGQGFSNNQD